MVRRGRARPGWLLLPLGVAVGEEPSDCPESNLYPIASPMFDRVTIRPGDGAPEFVLEARTRDPGDIHIQSMTLDGRPWTAYALPHESVAGGATLEVELGPEPLRH